MITQKIWFEYSLANVKGLIDLFYTALCHACGDGEVTVISSHMSELANAFEEMGRHTKFFSLERMDVNGCILFTDKSNENILFKTSGCSGTFDDYTFTEKE
jgi:hypothetical protein